MLIDITSRVEAIFSESRIDQGFCHIQCPHTTAGITINEGADPDVARDILDALERLVPTVSRYRHAEGNSDAHIKSSIVGIDAVLPVVNGRLSLGKWQSLFFCEFDGPRTREVWIRLL